MSDETAGQRAVVGLGGTRVPSQEHHRPGVQCWPVIQECLIRVTYAGTALPKGTARGAGRADSRLSRDASSQKGADMQALMDLIFIAGFVLWVWWLLSTRTALKAIQRKLGADPKWEAMQQARAYRTEQDTQRRADHQQVS